MKIGMDLDEVIADFFESLLKFYHRKFGKMYRKEEFKEWKWWPQLGATREDAAKIIDEFHETHHLDEVKPLEHAVDSLHHLLKDNQIFIITSRPARFKSKVELWIKHHMGDVAIEIVHAGDFHIGQGKTKAEICRDRGISLFLEDSPGSALECANSGIKVLLFDNPWNQEVSHQNITRVKNWIEALEVIEHAKQD